METNETKDANDPIFKDVKFYVVGDINEEVLNLLKTHGGKKDSYLSEMVSHVIADDHTLDEYSEAKELFDLPVVSTQWVYLSVLCKKQLPISQFALEGLPFSGVVAVCSQLDKEDVRSLWGMITYNGGQCRSKLDKTCTHLITTAVNGGKYEAALKNEDSVKIVCPDWVTASIQAGSHVDELPYHPRFIKPPTPTPPPTPSPPPQEEVPEELPIQPLLKQPLPDHIRPPMMMGQPPRFPHMMSEYTRMQGARPRKAGPKQGSRPGLPHPPHMNPTLERPPYSVPGYPPHIPPPPLPPGMQYRSAEPNQKNPRTLRNITNGADVLAPMTSMRPASNRMNQMLGMDVQMPQRPPPPKYNFPGISLPQQRPPQPPHAAVPQYWGHDPSDNVPMEMCLLGCVFYVTDYLKILGAEAIEGWKKVIEQYGGQMDTAYSNRVTHLLCANQHSDVFHIALKDQRRVVTAFWLNDVLVKKKMVPPWQSLHIPIIYNDVKPCSNQIICVTNFDGEERLRVKQMINAIGAKYTGYMTHTNSALISNKPEGKKYEKAKDWRIPVVNVQWLSDLVLGHLDALKLPVNNKYIALGFKDQFNLDYSKISHLMVGWQVPLKIQKETWKKFLPLHKSRHPPVEGQENLNINRNDNNQPPNKKMRLEMDESLVKNSTSPYKILFTGYPRGMVWKFQPMVQQLGGMVTENPQLCTHVVAPALTRTIKFFIAINVCKHIITKEWLEHSLSSNRFVDENQYHLKDVTAEKEMQCNLQESLKRAQSKKLLEGLSLYISPSVTPSVPDLTRIVESAGGKVVKKRQNLKSLSKIDELGHCQNVVVTCERDLHLFRDMIARKMPLHNTEFILMGVLRQSMNFKDFLIDVH